MRPRLLACAVLSAVSLHAFAVPVGINPAGQALVDRGQSLFAQGQAKQAFEAYQEAAKADPASSMPDSLIASMLFALGDRSAGEQRDKNQAQAMAYARKSLAINSADPLANELMRVAQDTAASPLHVPTREAAQLVESGENLFVQKRYAEALAAYESAGQRDPQYSAAWVYAGDCFYAQQRWAEAEVRFRQAATIEPLNGQAWRFLSDALAQQGKTREAQEALLSGIAAQPSQRPNWDKLDSMMRAGGVTMARLTLRNKPVVKPATTTGTMQLQIDPQTFGSNGSADGTFWVSYGLALSVSGKERAASPFSAELGAFRTAFQVHAELQEKEARPFADPNLTLLAELSAKGQLEAAILLLMYRESYRPEFEAWKTAHPNGVREFVLLHNVRP